MAKKFAFFSPGAGATSGPATTRPVAFLILKAFQASRPGTFLTLTVDSVIRTWHVLAFEDFHNCRYYFFGFEKLF